MIRGAVGRRYAAAIFEIGVQQETLEAWRDDIRVIAEYFGNRRLAFVLQEPKIPFKRKELIVSDLLGEKVQHEALNLAQLLVERGLVDLAPRIRDEFEKLYNDYRGQAIAQVTTAIPLDDQLRTSIMRDLQEITGKHILLQEQVDPAILGGVIARVGDTLIDGSLKRRFALLRQQMLQGGSLGGPGDGGSLAVLGDPSGDGSGGGQAIGGQPLVVGPQGNGHTGSNGSGKSNGSGPAASATATASRAADVAHLAPVSTTTKQGTPVGRRSGASGDRSGSRNKRRRR